MLAKRLLHLRYLRPSFPVARFSTMKPVKTNRVIPIFSRMFPHKLKYQSFGSLDLSSNNNSSRQREPKNQFSSNAIRNLSSRSGRAGAASSSGREVRESRSLIDDEAELSDWVSGLSSNSVKKTQLYSESDKDDDESESHGFGRGRGGGREQKGGKRRRESGFDDFSGSGVRGTGRDSMEKFPRRTTGGNVSSSRKGWELNERYSAGGARGKGRSGGEVEGIRHKKKGDRDLGSRLEMDRNGGRGIKGLEKGGQRGFLMSEDDDEEENVDEDEHGKGYRSFKELIGSDEGSEDVDDDEEDDDEGGDNLFKGERVLARCSSEDGGEPSSPGSSDSYLSETRFDKFTLSPSSMKGLKDAGYEKMTVVQEATLPLILKGKDVMAKARTGTGKTVAFLLPSIEVVVKTPAAPRDSKRPPILVLVICPTRELACQASQEGNKLLKYHPSIGVQVVIGGTRLALEQKRMQTNPCQILVATPGRLRDHIENTAGFATRLMGVKVLVLDEADHLLDMGFRKDIEKIIAAVPKQRQTLLFSATIPQQVRQICHIALKRDHDYINTVPEGTEDTHAQVAQRHLVAPLDNHFTIIYALLKEHIADNVDYKVLVFCTTAMVTRLVAELLGELHMNVREIHSRKSQSYRTKVSDEFRKSKGLILVTSDVSARGVDYPDVSLVIQIGLPADRQQYIHRLGRTGRKGKEGQGILLLAPWEEFFLSTIKDLPISKAQAPLVDPDTRKKVERALSNVGKKDKESAYQAWIGYYNSNKTVGRDKYRLVELANEFSRTMGLDTPPAIPKLVIGKMGLRNIPGLRSK